MVDLTGYISYREAKRILNDSLQTSDDEIALWVSGVLRVTLAAYVIGFRGKLIPFLDKGSRPFGGENYIRPLEGLYFLPAEVEQFKPDKRFITWRELVERWKKYNNGDKARTIDLIDGRRGGGLFEYHPVYGAPESLSGEGFERGLFDWAQVGAIESELMDVDGPKDKSSLADKPRKRLTPIERDATESLLLIYRIAESKNIEFLDELPAAEAWGLIVSKKFTDDLIKEHPINDKGDLVLNGGESLDRKGFMEKYRGRFKTKT